MKNTDKCLYVRILFYDTKYPPTPPLQGERAKEVSEVRFHLSIFPWSSFIFFSESELRQFLRRLLLTVLQMLFRQPVRGRIDQPLDLNPAEVSLFRLWLHCWGFLCLWLHHLSVSLGRQNATLESFTGDGFGRSGLESCWGFPVSHACPTEPFDFRLRLESCQGLPWFCFAFNGFPDAVSAARLGTKWPPLALESCWGFHVSHACPTEPFEEELASA